MPIGVYARTRRPPAERFWPKVNKTDTCWLWMAGKNEYGYGRFDKTGAHRFSYTEKYGAIPEGMELDHLCRVRDCVNPDHLEPVSQYENNMRSLSPVAICARRKHCHRGHEFDGMRRGYRSCSKCRKLDGVISQRVRRERKLAALLSEAK